MSYELQKLIKAYNQHGSIIVALDFDDTIFPYTENHDIKERCEALIELIQSIRKHIVLCLFSCDNEHTMRYKVKIMELSGINPDFVNDSPVKIHGETKKPYYNILLDDKAGLSEATQLLINFKNQIL